MGLKGNFVMTNFKSASWTMSHFNRTITSLIKVGDSFQKIIPKSKIFNSFEHKFMAYGIKCFIKINKQDEAFVINLHTDNFSF